MAASTIRCPGRRTAIAAIAALLAVLLPTSTGSALLPVVVAANDALEAAATAIAEAGGQAIRPLGGLGMVAADLPADRIGALERDPRIAAVTPDTVLEVSSEAFTLGDSAALGTVGQPQAVADGHVGAGVGVAVLDTGVHPHPEIEDRLVAAFDVSGEGDPDDRYGHGTFMAGLIAGARTGVAPGAHLVSVKVAGADGTTTLSRVIEGLALVDSVRDSLDVEVLLVALSAPAHPGRDPLEIALEQLWARGLTVVVAAGNDGGHVGTPGSAPHVITVGALDDSGTASASDDTIPAWSSRGGRAHSADKPELVAPGASVVSLRAEGSTLDADHPQARVGESYFRGSGTSMAAALTAGAAATVLGASTGSTPDGVKGQLLEGAAPAPAAASPARGVLDVPDAVAAPPVNGNGRHAAVPTLDRISRPAGLPAAVPAEVASDHAEAVDVAGWRWADGEWTGWRWAGWRWAGWRWAGWRWAGWRWAGWRWSDAMYGQPA